MELVPIHTLGGTEGDQALAQCVRILNYEWPRSETIRLYGSNIWRHFYIFTQAAGSSWLE